MNPIKKTRLGSVTIVYWFLLIYILTALIWWFIELESQNREMMHFRLEALDRSLPTYERDVQQIHHFQQRELRKFILEGITFLALIILGAFYVYRAVRNQIRVQQQEQNFLMAVTHELKTPIAVAQLNLETLQKHQLSESQQKNMFATTLQEIRRLDTLASNILVSAQLEGGKYRMASEDLDFSALVDARAMEFRQRFPQRKIIAHVEPDIEMRGDPLLLEMLVNNLIENALKYSAREASITITLSSQGKEATLEVADEGNGIDPKERKNIFKKFYRIGNENTRSTRGTGLGLYLCKKITEDHKGSISVRDNTPSGSVFRVTFQKSST